MLLPAASSAVHLVRTGPRGGPPVVLLHAIGMDLTLWGPQIAALEPRHDVVALDLPGHGLSAPLTGPLSFARLAAVVARVIDELAAGPVHLVGLSFGSMVAQAVALARPQAVRSLVLIGAAGTFAEPVRGLLRERAQFARTNGMRALAPLSLARWFTPGFARRRPDVLDRAAKLQYQQDPAYHAALWDIIAELDTLPHLPALALPALVLVGAEDTSTPVAAAQLLATALGTTQLHVVPGASHFTNLEAPAAVNNLLLGFFASLS